MNSQEEFAAETKASTPTHPFDFTPFPIRHKGQIKVNRRESGYQVVGVSRVASVLGEFYRWTNTGEYCSIARRMPFDTMKLNNKDYSRQQGPLDFVLGLLTI